VTVLVKSDKAKGTVFLLTDLARKKTDPQNKPAICQINITREIAGWVAALIDDKNVPEYKNLIRDYIAEIERIRTEEYYPAIDVEPDAAEDLNDVYRQVAIVYDRICIIINKFDLIDWSGIDQGYGGGFGSVQEK